MYRVYSLRTTTGEVGSAFDPVSATWGIELNKVEEFSVTVKKSELLRRDKMWWHPWSGGVLITHTGKDGFEHPLVAGPIHDYGTETLTELTLSCAGIRKIFERRVIDKNIRFEGTTYGEMMWELVQAGMDGKPGGNLPIVRGTPYETGEWEMTYYGWNLANNSVDKLLTERSEIIGGPDIMFRPRWVEGKYQRQIEWVMVWGTKLNPLIPQTRTPDFDTTASQSDVSTVSLTSSARNLRHKVWYTGSGEGEGIVRVSAQDLSGVEAGQPFLEQVFSESDTDSADLLQRRAAGALSSSSQMVDQLTIGFSVTSTKNPLGTFFVGDMATVTLKDWINIPDGTRQMVIIKMNGSLESTVTLDFQEGTW